jgi:hypothetical protein
VNVVVLLINTIKKELPATFVPLKIIVYLIILAVNLPCRIDDSYSCYQSSSVSLEWLSNHVSECSALLEQLAEWLGIQPSVTKSIIMHY